MCSNSLRRRGVSRRDAADSGRVSPLSIPPVAVGGAPADDGAFLRRNSVSMVNPEAAAGRKVLFGLVGYEEAHHRHSFPGFDASYPQFDLIFPVIKSVIRIHQFIGLFVQKGWREGQN